MHEASHEPGLKLGPAKAAVPTTEETPALYLPIWALSEAHIGRKIRTEGRVLAFDVASSHLLLASATNPFEPQAPIRTVLVSTKVALSGQSPAAKDVSAARDGVNPTQLGRGSWERRYEPPRLSLDRGSWVTVVGWLDAASAGRSRKTTRDGQYAPPLPAILDTIHLAGRSAPPVDATYREPAAEDGVLA